MTRTLPCACLSWLDKADNRRCEHDSWGVRRPGPDRHWANPHHELPLPLLALAAATCGVLLAGLLLLGQTTVCAIHHDQHPICEGYQPTTTEENP